MAYKAINTMDSMVGYKNDKYLYFGRVAAILDDIVNYIPARITGVLIGVSAFFLGLDERNSMRILRRDCRNHTSPNSGFPEAAVAGALGVQLGGLNSYFGVLSEKPLIGEKRREFEIADIHRTAKLMYGSTLVFLIISTIIWTLIKFCI